MQIRTATQQDATAIAAIYNPYVLNSTISFEESPVTDSAMAERIALVSADRLPWLVAELDGVIAGYAYATKWRARPAYRFSVETSAYLSPLFQGQGIASSLYHALLCQLKDGGIHTVIAGIALPNEKSIRLHERFGFKRTALFEQVGWKFNQWVDVGYWQRML